MISEELLIEDIARYGYLRPYSDKSDYVITKTREDHIGMCDRGLPLPPKRLWIGYGSTTEQYLESGARHTKRMLEVVRGTDFEPLTDGHRILDFGCGAGRMMRHFIDAAEKCKILGCDLGGDHIIWSKQYLSPPFSFIINTTTPHLPFSDGRFNFIYCGSVFSHIDDLADTWLCELRRITAPGGRLFISLHDETTVSALKGMNHRLGDQILESPFYQKYKDNFNVLVIDRGTWAQTFYDISYFVESVKGLGWKVLSVTPMAYGYQTGVVLTPD